MTHSQDVKLCKHKTCWSAGRRWRDGALHKRIDVLVRENCKVQDQHPHRLRSIQAN